jgi:hypothetical protein
MLTAADLQDIANAKRDIPLADAVILWNEPAAADYGFEPVGVLVLPQSPPMDSERTRGIYGSLMDRYGNSRGNCTMSWVNGTTLSRLTELGEIADNMFDQGLPRETVSGRLR